MINIFLFALFFIYHAVFSLQASETLRSIEIQEILGPPHKTLKDQDRRTSCAIAYGQLHEWFDSRVLRAEGEDIVKQFNKPDNVKKFIRLLSTGVNFLGWSTPAAYALTQSQGNYEQWLTLLSFSYKILPLYGDHKKTQHYIKDKFTVAEARLTRFRLEEQMKQAGQTYEEADHG